MLGRPISGADAAAWGMVHRAVPDEELGAAVDALVGELAAAPTVAIGLTKRCLHGAPDGTIGAAMAAEAMAIEMSSRTAHFSEVRTASKRRRSTRVAGRAT